MYFYIYDSFVHERRHKKTLEQIDTRLSHLGISGKIYRLNILHHQKEIIEECIRKGAKTIVFVGNDRSALHSIDTIARHKVTIGFLPVGNERTNRVARALGIPLGARACDILARRRVLSLDLGVVNKKHFLTEAVFTSSSLLVSDYQTTHTIQTTTPTRAILRNCSLATDTLRHDPHDGLIELIIAENRGGALRAFALRSRERPHTIIPFERLLIAEPEGATIELDGVRTTTTPAIVRVVRGALRCVVGRDRSFE